MVSSPDAPLSGPAKVLKALCLFVQPLLQIPLRGAALNYTALSVAQQKWRGSCSAVDHPPSSSHLQWLTLNTDELKYKAGQRWWIFIEQPPVAVAYINYEKASSAAMAIEGMHEKVLNDGRGPMVKVMFAEAPKNGQG